MAVGNATTDLENPNDFLLESCKILDYTGDFTDIKPSVAEFNYFEDLFGNCCSAKVMLNDSLNISEKMSWSGDEFLIFSIKKPGNDNKPLNKILRIYTTNEKNLTKDTNENFVIYACSEEMYLTQQYKISKSYKNKKIHEIVQDIAINFLNISPEEFPASNIVPTLGKYDIVIPYLMPIEAINWLCTFALAEDTRLIGASYLFYQDRDAWNFKPILGIYGDYERYGRFYPDTTSLFSMLGLGTSMYWYGTKKDGEPMKESDIISGDMTSIISYKVLNCYDTFEATQDGSFSNLLFVINNIIRTHTVAVFDYPKYFSFLRSNLPLYRDYQPHGLMSTAVNRFNDSNNEAARKSTMKVAYSTTHTSNTKYVMDHDVNIPDNNLEKAYQYRYAQLKLVSAVRLKLAIPGDPYIKIGDVIYVYLKSPGPESSGDIMTKKKDKFFSGRYLVTAVRHRFNQESEFDTTLEVCKDSFESEVELDDVPGLLPYNNGSPYLIKARKQGTF